MSYEIDIPADCAQITTSADRAETPLVNPETDFEDIDQSNERMLAAEAAISVLIQTEGDQ